jgi:leader peptidase (prepilin peptidase)/N-methyltransferase
MSPAWDWILPLAWAPFFGSFLAVLAVRLPNGEDVVSARSHCRSCGKGIRVYDLIPVASWLALRGRCRDCGEPIGVIYPVVEIAAAIVVLWASFLLSGWLLWATIGLGWTLLALAAMDASSLVLSDALTIPLTLVGLIVVGTLAPSNLGLHAAAAAVGFAVMVGVAFVYCRVCAREGLGLGDAKLMAAAGAWTGIEGIGSVLLYGAAGGLCLAFVMQRLGHPIHAETEIPFGAAIACGIWLVWLCGPLFLST